ncbi:alpha/beta hydrolase [Azotobacter chroococcum]|nr:alpha/beta hydrolase [Azotobacter chroococcum]TKD34234.1 alpha/beta hydrolase [Azotobacter chroococcum]
MFMKELSLSRRSYPALLALSLPAAMAAESPLYGPELEGFDYPHPVQYFTLESQGQSLKMAYMDVQPAESNGHTLVLLHGKNFCAATWEGSIAALSKAGYRVVAPDQIGFCKSSKPAYYQYSFQQLAANTRALLESLGLARYSLMGHSMGGMLATRFALLYPKQLERLVLVNPIGLEDWKAVGVPYRTVDQWYARELETSAEGIRNYQLSTYYAGQWRPEFDRWVEMQAGLFQGPGRQRVAWNSALTYDMIYTQPVYYEFEQLKVPTLLLIGEKDNTAIGKDAVAPELRPLLGDYRRLSWEAAKRIPGATLQTFADLGHSPQIQAPERFHETLLQQLAKPAE